MTTGDKKTGNSCQWVVSVHEHGMRLDLFLRERDIEPTRSQIKQFIEGKLVIVDGVPVVKPSRKLHTGQLVSLTIPPPEPLNAIPQDIPLDIRFEDKDVIVLNKPQGMVVHPAPGHPSGTLVNGLVYRFAIAAGDPQRPGLVHRLDKDTSGLMVVAKTEAALRNLVVQFQEHTVDRRYRVLVAGHPPEFLEIDTFHNRKPNDRKLFSSRVSSGKRARSTVRTLEYLGDGALITVTLHTGRTHQVRVHCFDNGFPLLGDPLYVPRHLSRELMTVHKMLPGQALHAELLGFDHPVTGERMIFKGEPPQIFMDALDRMRLLHKS
jgi:23S rRNA pseudouridine1911/1915/1917 synthase